MAEFPPFISSSTSCRKPGRVWAEEYLLTCLNGITAALGAGMSWAPIDSPHPKGDSQ
jgi:hypothetical protein